MDTWEVTLEIPLRVEAQTKEEAIKRGIDDASWQFFTTFNSEHVVRAKKVKGHFNSLGTFVKD